MQPKCSLQSIRRLIGSPSEFGLACFHAAVRLHPRLPSPKTSQFSVILRSSLPPRVPSFTSPLAPFRAEHYLPGSRPSPRHHDVASTLTGHSKSRSVPPPGVRNLSAVCSTSSLVGLFHPTAVLRTHLVQGLLSPRSRSTSSVDVAPLPLARDLLFLLAQRGRSSRASTSRLCSTPRCVLAGWVINRPDGRSLLRVHAPPGALLAAGLVFLESLRS